MSVSWWESRLYAVEVAEGATSVNVVVDDPATGEQEFNVLSWGRQSNGTFVKQTDLLCQLAERLSHPPGRVVVFDAPKTLDPLARIARRSQMALPYELTSVIDVKVCARALMGNSARAMTLNSLAAAMGVDGDPDYRLTAVARALVRNHPVLQQEEVSDLNAQQRAWVAEWRTESEFAKGWPLKGKWPNGIHDWSNLPIRLKVSWLASSVLFVLLLPLLGAIETHYRGTSATPFAFAVGILFLLGAIGDLEGRRKHEFRPPWGQDPLTPVPNRLRKALHIALATCRYLAVSGILLGVVIAGTILLVQWWFRWTAYWDGALFGG